MEIGRLGFELFEPMDLLKTGKCRWIFEYFGHQIDIKFREDYENPVVFLLLGTFSSVFLLLGTYSFVFLLVGPYSFVFLLL